MCLSTYIHPLLSFLMGAFRRHYGKILQLNTIVLKLIILHSNLDNHEFKTLLINLRFNAFLKIEIVLLSTGNRTSAYNHEEQPENDVFELKKISPLQIRRKVLDLTFAR